jgi:hypothetical protein
MMMTKLTPGALRAAEAVVRSVAEYNELSGIHIMLPSIDKVAEIIERETGLGELVKAANAAISNSGGLVDSVHGQDTHVMVRLEDFNALVDARDKAGQTDEDLNLGSQS